MILGPKRPPVRYNRARLDGGRGASLKAKPARNHSRGICTRSVVVTLMLRHVCGQVGRQVFVNECRFAGERLLEIDDRVEWVVVDKHVLRGILREVAAVGDHNRDGFAHEAHLVACKRVLRARVEGQTFDGRRIDQEWPELPVIAEIRGREYAGNTRATKR
jgi:hypothetical protein